MKFCGVSIFKNKMQEMNMKGTTVIYKNLSHAMHQEFKVSHDFLWGTKGLKTIQNWARHGTWAVGEKLKVIKSSRSGCGVQSRVLGWVLGVYKVTRGQSQVHGWERCSECEGRAELLWIVCVKNFSLKSTLQIWEKEKSLCSIPYIVSFLLISDRTFLTVLRFFFP